MYFINKSIKVGLLAGTNEECARGALICYFEMSQLHGRQACEGSEDDERHDRADQR
jgi:hypothetical protein